jgi:uncharacterized protein YkwD
VPITQALDHAEIALVRTINTERARRGLRILRPSRRLSRAADRHTADMLRRGRLDHASANGAPFAARLRAVTSWTRLGEVLAWTPHQASSARMVVRLWLNSAPHRDQILGRSYRRIGVGRRRGWMGGGRGVAFTVDLASQR